MAEKLGKSAEKAADSDTQESRLQVQWRSGQLLAALWLARAGTSQVRVQVPEIPAFPRRPAAFARRDAISSSSALALLVIGTAGSPGCPAAHGWPPRRPPPASRRCASSARRRPSGRSRQRSSTAARAECSGCCACNSCSSSRSTGTPGCAISPSCRQRLGHRARAAAGKCSSVWIAWRHQPAAPSRAALRAAAPRVATAAPRRAAPRADVAVARSPPAARAAVAADSRPRWRCARSAARG